MVESKAGSAFFNNFRIAAHIESYLRPRAGHCLCNNISIAFPTGAKNKNINQ